ncbi:MAG TPA: hypothetical protein VFV19_04595 [Candidatus Polarisedimenticolaceae bacterium]|nr:hypothetical protein [Candidatus Polarisedimenticolaceae bacterium]
MKRNLLVVFAAIGLVSAGFAIAHAQNRWNAPQPDTSSPQWKAVSSELGVWITESETFGLQARLYVLVDGKWVPVAVDGTREMHGVMPVR